VDEPLYEPLDEWDEDGEWDETLDEDKWTDRGDYE
jgi:hypothetical protein